ncbi:unnamed protein product [Clonostachys rosea]|uniref:Uncharacterized protein n=1 Tax=Bionectria ochroleuca TaxID=29856 RepID=A0ABY6TQ28_BIOOC|nr:unnamed protein product [Clonostachys rosea]
MTSFTTLRSALTQRKPSIACHTTNKKSAKNKKWPEISGNIKFWPEFNIETLNGQFGGTLNMMLPDDISIPQADEELTNIAISHNTDIKKIIAWNASILEPTLEFGRSALRLHPGLGLSHEHLKPSIPDRARVDHLVSLADSPSRVLVAGIGTTSKKFDGNSLLTSITPGNTSNSMPENPVRQLASTCAKVNARYGYLQTDNELVVCRFILTDGVYKTSFRGIPLSSFGDGVMTADLALWWLAMLALPHECDSTIVPRQEMPQLNESISAGEGVVNRHTDPLINLGFSGSFNGSSQMANSTFPSGTNIRPSDNSMGLSGSSAFDPTINTDLPSHPNLVAPANNAGYLGGFGSDSLSNTFSYDDRQADFDPELMMEFDRYLDSGNYRQAE